MFLKCVVSGLVDGQIGFSLSQNIIDMLCILDLSVMCHRVIRDSICPYFEAPNVINLALAQILVNSTSLFFSAVKDVKSGRQSM